MTAVTGPEAGLTFTDYAVRIGKSRPYISKLVAQGRIRPPALTADKRIIPDLADQQILEGADPARHIHDLPSGNDATYARERTLKTAAERERAELELAVRRGELVQRSTVATVILPAANRLRERITQLIRDKVMDEVDRSRAEQAALDTFEQFAMEIDPNGGAQAAG